MIDAAGSVAVVEVGFVYQTTVYLPMNNFGGLDGLEQGAVPAVDMSQSFHGGADVGVAVKH